jgi:hypothetical protein
MDPYMAGRPVVIEMVNDESHQLHKYKLIILNPSQLHMLSVTNPNEKIIKQL